MDRDYNNGKKDDVIFFTGREIEKTPAYDKETLFVVGIQPVEDILKIVNRTNIDHVYLGANQSFKLTGEMGTDDEQEGWDSMVNTLLKQGLWVTLDYDVAYHNWILESGYNEHDNFISMISVKLPYIEQLNYNACIKVDDSGFKQSNPGVWVYYANELKDRKKFTPWSEYGEDQPIQVDTEH